MTDEHFHGKGILAHILSAAGNRRIYPSAFSPFRLDLSYSGVHVHDRSVPPHEVTCSVCERVMLPIGFRDTPEDQEEAIELLATHCPHVSALDVGGAERWVCFVCSRGVIVTWSAKV